MRQCNQYTIIRERQRRIWVCIDTSVLCLNHFEETVSDHCCCVREISQPEEMEGTFESMEDFRRQVWNLQNSKLQFNCFHSQDLIHGTLMSLSLGSPSLENSIQNLQLGCHLVSGVIKVVSCTHESHSMSSHCYIQLHWGAYLMSMRVCKRHIDDRFV